MKELFKSRKESSVLPVLNKGSERFTNYYVAAMYSLSSVISFYSAYTLHQAADLSRLSMEFAAQHDLILSQMYSNIARSHEYGALANLFLGVAFGSLSAHYAAKAQSK